MSLRLIILFVIIIAGIVYKHFTDRKKYENVVYQKNLEIIKSFLDIIHSLNDYVTWVHRDHLKAEYAKVGKFFRNKTNYYKKESTVKNFNEIFEDFDNYIVEYNQNYVKTKQIQLKDYFDNIEGKKLDVQQRNAVITDEYSNLIIAGAGSGKTLTILGKVQYLIEQKNIPENEILLLSFTQKTVSELNERLKNINISTQATTFHKLGFDTIKTHLSNTPAVTNENTLTNVIKSYLQKDILENTTALQSFIQYVTCYMNIPEEYDNYDSLGEKIDMEKGIDFQTLKSKCEPLNIVAKAKHDTIQGERVKSVEELMIANFFYLHGINYEYEKPYPHGDTMYRPDFYLKDYDIYLEHFGVNEHNRAQWLTPLNEQKYVDEMHLKRETHKTYNTKLIETYSYYNRDKILLQKLQEMLTAEQVTLRPRDVKDIYAKVTSNDQHLGDEIIRLIESFINLSKSRRLSSNELVSIFLNKKSKKNDFMYERQGMFLQFVLPILEKYNNTLKERNELDFNDMINLATDLIIANKPRYKYKHIIIDEYQDISFSRFNLIKEIRDLCNARLICVGDDWQSIYRFAGSDISLFSNFGKYVGEYQQLLIEQTYRNSQSLIDITSKYILKNPIQLKKKPKSQKENLANPIKFVNYNEGDIKNVLIDEISSLVHKYGNKSILILGRHSFDINEIITLTSANTIKYYESSGKLEIKGFEQMDIKYLTVHKSKGTEADNVIVLKLQNDLLGFPNKMTDDPIISLLLSDNEEYKFAEERRLFYVALTRTKNEVILLTPSDTSLFVEELLMDNNYVITSNGESLKTTTCPYCKSGKLIIRKNTSNASQFLGCSHYPMCNQTFKDLEILNNSIMCSSCQSGYMIRKSGKYGNFLGCSCYPRCKNTIKLN
ncbi:UvrD-helicase domain-containing protein [Sphingobacterium sp. SGL-16]|uniref:UvrD-helicase domain-containing protein n=1 Tax=Sphingobacterium sp. SGL-16 TaxID=2710883 RepID=UPI0013EB382F|nr:UvrD-helicase domain-containing protein [Sphingobacterium sp. SGL-16]NGM72841.1 UvrD-helicase domain-containing protein [Sphingobacterium sp. SGL-16]